MSEIDERIEALNAEIARLDKERSVTFDDGRRRRLAQQAVDKQDEVNKLDDLRALVEAST